MRQPDVHGAKRFIRPVTYGILFGAGACFLLLLIMSAVMGLRDIPQTAVSLIATLIFVLGGFVAGYVSAAFAREKGMLLGLCCGACLFVILSLASLAVDGGGFGMVALTSWPRFCSRRRSAASSASTGVKNSAENGPAGTDFRGLPA